MSSLVVTMEVSLALRSLLLLVLLNRMDCFTVEPPHPPHPPHPDHHHEPEHNGEKFYQYGYQVEDTFTGDYHGHMEHTAGHLTKGEYKVALPDGRVQVVSYEADQAGFRPRISYEASHIAEPAPYHPEIYEPPPEEQYEVRRPPPPSYDPRQGSPYQPPRQEVLHHQLPHQEMLHQPPHQEALHQEALHQEALHQEALHQDALHQEMLHHEMPVIKIPHQSPEEVYSVTDKSVLLPLLPTPLPRHQPHHRMNYNHIPKYQLATPTPDYHETEPAYHAQEHYSPPEHYSPLEYFPQKPAHYSPAPEHYSPVPEHYSPAPEHYSPAPEHYSPPKHYSSPENYSPSEHYSPPEHYSPQPTHYSPAPKDYSPAPEHYSGVHHTKAPNHLSHLMTAAPVQHQQAAVHQPASPVHQSPAQQPLAGHQPPAQHPVEAQSHICPAPSFLPSKIHCEGRTDQCWGAGLPDPDCLDRAPCCHDGCANVCLGRGPVPGPGHLGAPRGNRRQDTGGPGRSLDTGHRDSGKDTGHRNRVQDTGHVSRAQVSRHSQRSRDTGHRAAGQDTRAAPAVTTPRPRRALPTAYHAMSPPSHTYIPASPAPQQAAPRPSPAPRLVHKAEPRPRSDTSQDLVYSYGPQGGHEAGQDPSLYPYLYVLSSYVPQRSKGSSLVVAKRG